jgi:hypothetical protein
MYEDTIITKFIEFCEIGNLNRKTKDEVDFFDSIFNAKNKDMNNFKINFKII